MCTINMSFNIPESKAIDIEALKKQINDLVNVILARPSVLISDTPTTSWTKEFRGKWQDENMTAEEFVREIRNHRSVSNIIEL